jgi:hypothetical protein
MKIGILTFHDGINHGAYLQCYSLMKVLQRKYQDVNVINYKNINHWLAEYRVFLIRKNPILALRNIVKIYKFHKVHKKFNLDKLTFSRKKIFRTKYDAIIVGSDIIWNYKNVLFGFDPIYFGDGLNTNNLISYAASFGAITVNDTPPDDVIHGLNIFRQVSVRDNNSKKLVEKYISKEAQVVLDPTFLYDFSGEEVLPEHCNFIMIYAFYMPDNIKQEIQNFAAKNNLLTVSVGYPNSWCDKNIVTADPFEWLGYFKEAKFVVTSTFHGTIFSIKYNKKFVTIGNEPINNKVIHLLAKTNLMNVLIKEGDSEITSKLESDYHYDKVNANLREEVEKSKMFLFGAINSDKENN